MSSTEVTNPQQRRTNNRRKKLNKIWKGDEWKEKCKTFIGDKSCSWCGSKDNLLVHHPYLESYKGCYTDLELSGCIVLCNRCHFSLHRGLVLCPICKEHYYRVGGEMCKACFLKEHPEIIKAREEYIRLQKEQEAQRKREAAFARKLKALKHPCKFHGVNQKCRFTPYICPYSPRNAKKDCVAFTVRGVKA